MMSLAHVVEGAAVFIAGAGISFFLVRRRERKFQEKTRAEAERVLHEARSAANEEALKLREQTEQSLAARSGELAQLETRLSERESLINSQLQRVVDAEKNLDAQKAALQSKADEVECKSRELDELVRQQRESLQRISGLNEAEARQAFLRKVEEESVRDASHLTRHILDEARLKAEEKARQIIGVAIQRYASQHTFEITTASVALPNDEIKGRIIGREGRNIRAFEAAAGVTILVDDTPGVVVISGFDPVRREVARESMQRLIQDGRIHPARIEEVVAQVSTETEETILRLGEKAVRKAGLPPLALEVVKLLGRLHFRHSYSQNILDHSVEVAHLTGLMAAELGVDVATAKRAGLLHDIGKAVNHEIEGPHAVVGAELLKRHGETEMVVNGVASHHNDVPPVGPLGILVSAADAISASRPGARSESTATYLNRIERLEKIAASFAGVEKCFAVQAGRELRVFVQPEQINEEEAFMLARKIASQIQNELQYPGQIKVTVIRETRCVEIAK